MRFWKITRWNGMSLEMTVVEADCLYNALMQSAHGSMDGTIIKIEEVASG